jgi:hypothetical protein
MMLHRSFSHAALWVALGLGLLAPRVLADQGQCESTCATKASSDMQTCLERCPEARDPTKASSFQACAMRCKDRFDSALNTCAEHCPKKAGSESGSKKKKHKQGAE